MKEKKSKTVLSEEVAQKQLDLLLSFYELDVDSIEDDDIRTAVEKSAPKVLKAIQKGKVEITHEDKLLIKQTLKSGDELYWKELSGIQKMAMDREKGDQARLYAFIGSNTGIGKSAVSKLKGTDLTLAEAIAALIFLS